MLPIHNIVEWQPRNTLASEHKMPLQIHILYWQPLVPLLNFLTLILHVLQSAWGRSGVAEDSPTGNNRFHGTKGDDRKTQRGTATSCQTSEPEIFGGGSCCPIWPTEFRILQGTLPGGFSMQHNSSS